MSNTVPGGETGPNGLPENEEQRSRLHAATCRATGVRNAAEAELVALIARVDAEEMWAADDARSIEHWIMWRLGVTRQRAHQYLAIARRREELPHAHGLYDQGRLSTDQMLILTRHCPVGYDRDMAEFATYATIPQLSRSLRRYEVDEPLDGNAGASGDEGAANPGPSLDPDLVGGLADFHVNEDGFRLLLRGSQADGLRIQAAIEQAKAWLDDDCSRDAASRIYDAVSFLITQGAAADPSSYRRDRARVFIHFDVDQRDRWRNHLHLGDALDPDTMKLLTCEADSQTILAKSGRSPHLGRTHRLVPDWLRVIIFDRDGSCRVPGCGRTLGLDVHHLRHWSDGGETNSDNLVTLCRRHHTLHHKGLLGISGTPEQLPGPGMPDGLTFTNHCGRRLEHPPPEPAPPPRDHPDPPVYQPPTGERLQTWAVHFNPNEPPDRRV